MAERAKAVFAAFFKWLASRDLIDAVPTINLDAYQKPVKRDRYLSDDEISKFFAAVEAMKAGDPIKGALKLALLTRPAHRRSAANALGRHRGKDRRG